MITNVTTSIAKVSNSLVQGFSRLRQPDRKYLKPANVPMSVPGKKKTIKPVPVRQVSPIEHSDLRTIVQKISPSAIALKNTMRRRGINSKNDLSREARKNRRLKKKSPPPPKTKAANTKMTRMSLLENEVLLGRGEPAAFDSSTFGSVRD
jgi:hypothetical protein